MKSLKRYFPTIDQIIHIYAIVVLVVYSWVILLFFYDIPRWVKFLSALEILVIFSYAIFFAFLESITFTVILIILSLIIHKGYLRKIFVPILGSIAIFSYLWIVFLRFLFQRELAKNSTWLAERFPVWLALSVASTILIGLGVNRSYYLQRIVNLLAEKALVFLYLYTPLSLFCIVVVILRNLR